MSSDLGERLKLVVEVWKKTVDVQQHFNDIGMRIRNFALTLLVGILGGTALALREGFTLQVMGTEITVASAFLVAGACGLAGFWFIDRRWYHRLLVGAVEHGESIERAYEDSFKELGLTRAITRTSRIRVHRASSKVAQIAAFASVVAAIGLMTIIAWVPSLWPPPTWLPVVALLGGVLLALALQRKFLPKWEMRARYRLDVFYALLIILLLLFARAAGVVVKETSLDRAVSRAVATEEPQAGWQLFVYATSEAEKNPLGEADVERAPRFKSVQACVAWGQDWVALNEAWSFECGLACRVDTSMGAVVCNDRTKRLRLVTEPSPLSPSQQPSRK